MILTVTLNLALDVTYRVRNLVLETSVRVEDVEQRAGGKGVNVARVLHQLGEPVMVSGFAGGATGAIVQADLDAAGLIHDLEPVGGETRRTVAIVDPAGRVTILLEPGPAVHADAERRGLQTIDAMDQELAQGLLQIMQAERTDFTNTFRNLTAATTNPNALNAAFKEWRAAW